MRKLLSILFLTLISYAGFGQRNYDTTFTGPNLQSGDLNTQAWNAKVYLPAGYSESGSDSFQCIIFFPGLGEMNTDISGLLANGPHVYLRDGWNGEVTLGNGTHRPIIISLQPRSQAHGRSIYVRPKVQAILNRYRIKRNSLHFTGLSQGGWTSTLFVGYQPSSGNYSLPAMVASIVNCGGVNPTDTYGSEPASPGRYAWWVQNRKGRITLIKQVNDGVASWMPAFQTALNGYQANSANYLTTNYGNGGHNTWEGNYGGNGYSPGVYSLDGVNQNIYQWMLRQGDTTNTFFISNGSGGGGDDNDPPVANAGPNRTIALPLTSIDLTGSGTDADGSIVSYKWTQLSGPTNATITDDDNDTTRADGLTSGIYIFRLTVTDDEGAIGTDDVTVTVNTEPAYSYTRLGLGEYQAFLIDPQQKLWGLSVGAAAVGAGVSSGRAVPPLAVLVNNKKIRDVSSGLHHSLACDEDGNVWTWGWNEQGQAGNGTTGADLFTPHKITVDSAGNPFTDVIDVETYYSNTEYSGNVALKKDGTVWVWGGTGGGLRGDGSDGGVRTRPVQVPIPGNRVVKTIRAGQVILALCTDGSIWGWGGAGTRVHNLGRGTGISANVNHRVPGRVINVPSNIVDITGGGQFSYALTDEGVLWGWGYYGSYLSVGTGGYPNNQTISTPRNLTTDLNLPHPVKKVVVNSVTTHVILTDGSLWGWGDNAVGSIGNGDEIDYDSYDPPYAWSIGPGQLMEQDPVNILPQYKDWIEIYGGTSYVFYKYAQRSNGQLYSWGRNKTGTLGDGVVGPHSSIIAVYPNSWDVPLATAVNPLGLSSATIKTSPYCLLNPSGSPCNLYTPPQPPGPQPVNSIKVPRGGRLKWSENENE